MKKTIALTSVLILALSLCLAFSACTAVEPAVEVEEPEATPQVVRTYDSEKAVAEEAMTSGEYDTAIESYEFMLGEQPASEEAVRGLAAAYEAKGDSEGLIQSYETLQKMDAFTAEDYIKLAGLYAEAGRSAEELELLQIASLLAPDAAYAPLMDAVVIDATTAEENTAAQFAALYDAMSKADTAAGARILCSDEWKTATAQLLDIGCKYIFSGEGSTLKVSTGFDGNERDDRAWIVGENGAVAFLHATADRVISTTVGSAKDGVLEGEFESLRLSFDEGVLFREKGTLKDGLCDGKLTSAIVWDDEEEDADIAAMLERKSASEEAAQYSGEFETGKAKAASQKGVEGVIYAYADGDKEYIYASLPEGANAEEFVFDYAVFGFELPPEW